MSRSFWSSSLDAFSTYSRRMFSASPLSFSLSSLLTHSTIRVMRNYLWSSISSFACSSNDYVAALISRSLSLPVLMVSLLNSSSSSSSTGSGSLSFSAWTVICCTALSFEALLRLSCGSAYTSLPLNSVSTSSGLGLFCALWDYLAISSGCHTLSKFFSISSTIAAATSDGNKL